MATLSPQEITERQQAHIIDVRSREEFAREQIPGSRCIPLDEIAQHVDVLKNQSVILSCQSGARAQRAQALLESLGLSDVRLLEGGINRWKQAGKPVNRFKAGPSLMRQVQMIAGTLILLGSLLKSVWWLVPIVGFGLLMAGLTGLCPMAGLLAKMPWNRLPVSPQASACSTRCCDAS